MIAKSAVIQGAESAFPKQEFDDRRARAKALLADAGTDLMVVTGPENIFYLTGQQTPGYYTFQTLILSVDHAPVFIVRELEFYNFRSNTFIEDVETYGDGDDPVDFLVDVIEKQGMGGKRVAIDKRGWFLPIAVYESLQARLGAIRDGAGIIESLRAVKSPLEIGKMELAARHADAGLRAGLAAIEPGVTENALVAAMMSAAIADGSEYLGMEPLVSSGPRAGIPHGTWRRRAIAGGDPIFLEMAACHDRYHAALMRSAWLGDLPDKARKMYDVCEEGLEAALAAIRPSVTCEDVHLACQKVIDRNGYTENYRKRTGYSIGISFAPDWGEGGVLSLYSGVKIELRPGMTFHIPPALRVYGEFTVGVSETIVVTERGYRVLGGVERSLLRITG